MEWDPKARARLGELMAVTPAQTVAVLNHLGLADLLAEGPMGASELSERVGVHPQSLYRLMRFAASYGVFEELEPGLFGLTAMAAYLRSDAPDSVYWKVEDDASIRPWWPWEEWIETLRTGQPAYDRVHGHSYWEGLGRDRSAREMFDLSLRSIVERQLGAVMPLLDLAGRHRVVDVSAGEGSWLAAILAGHPDLEGVGLDLAEARPGAQRRLEEAGVAQRAEVVVGDFFDSVPVGDVVLLANVLHDWDDERAGLILANCRRALEPGGAVVIVDRIMPEGNERHHAKTVDINMLFNLGGRERTLPEFETLLAGAGLALVRHESTDLPVGLIWAEPVSVTAIAPVTKESGQAGEDSVTDLPTSAAKPILVVVSGPSGSGKTTLAHELSRRIGCPAICRDEIKEGMVATLGGQFRPSPGDALTRRTFGVFFDVLGILVRSGASVIAEAAFKDRVWRGQLPPLAEVADLRIIHCRTDPELARHRMLDRGNRAAHVDASADDEIGYFATFERPSWPAPTLNVDTGDGYDPPADEIVRFVLEASR